MKTFVTNCHVISPNIEMENAVVEIIDNKISQVYTNIDSIDLNSADRVINAENNYVMPGFIDIHCHGRSGHDFTSTDVDGITTIAVDKLTEGVTSVLATTLTLPEDILTKSLTEVAKYMAKEELPGAKIPGVHLEGPYLNCKQLGAQNPDFVREPSIEEVERLNKIAKVLKVSFAIETEGGTEFVSQLKKAGICPSCVHSLATYTQFSEAHEQGLNNLSHFCNQMTALHHRDIGLVGAGFLHDDVTIEMICDRIHLSDPMIQLAFKIKTPNFIQLITDAMEASGLEDGEASIGGLEVVIKDGAARLKSNGALAGSTLHMNKALKNVYEITNLPLKELVKTTSLNQARELKLENLGKIEANYIADIVILDKEFNVIKAFVNGKQKI
ncbi:N-acetylglucosamine-6-phosphate deacetylase [Lentisphaerota bacterium WC36G]|nr:N-acetylglucosamine-6-phosphate deacetylase [Lentisphaerae bacterium WC36]